MATYLLDAHSCEQVTFLRVNTFLFTLRMFYFSPNNYCEERGKAYKRGGNVYLLTVAQIAYAQQPTIQPSLG